MIARIAIVCVSFFLNYLDNDQPVIAISAIIHCKKKYHTKTIFATKSKLVLILCST
jgi:hypothetical protein